MFAWLVRHEKLLAAVTLSLLAALFFQLRYTKRAPSAADAERQAGRAAEPTPAPPPPHAADLNPADVAGTWEMSVPKRRGGAQVMTLVLEQRGESLQGVIKSEGGDLEVSGTVRGSEVRLSGSRYGFEVVFTAALEGETLEGTMKTLSFERGWTARRK